MVRTPAWELFEFDLNRYHGSGRMAGADEAGRGSLAGPLVAAAVAFDYATFTPESFAPLLAALGESKRLTAKARERLYPLILRFADSASILVASARTIDSDGLHRTNLRLLGQSLQALDPHPLQALVDGFSLPRGEFEHQAIKGGDNKSACIAAASVLAKVTRDRLMRQLDAAHPQYGFSRHVGYATKVHLEAIAQHGFCELHRRSFNISAKPLKLQLEF